jgi:hypothetical protein
LEAVFYLLEAAHPVTPEPGGKVGGEIRKKIYNGSDRTGRIKEWGGDEGFLEIGLCKPPQAHFEEL